MTLDQVEQKIYAMFDGKLSDAELLELYQALENDFEARMVYYDAIGLQESLETHVRGREFSPAQMLDEDIQKKIVPLKSTKPRSTSALAAAAVLLLTCVGLLWWKATSQNEAVIASVKWSEGADVVLRGAQKLNGEAELEKGTSFVLNDGMAELLFSNGVRGVVEAPAAMSIKGELSVDLSYGKAWFDVPEDGHGFTVRSQDAVVKDLGTQFAVFSQYGAADEVFVFKGGVETAAQVSGVDPSLLREGEAVAISQEGVMKVIDVQSRRFHTSLDSKLSYLHWAFNEANEAALLVQGNLPTRKALTLDYLKGATPSEPVLTDGVEDLGVELPTRSHLRSNWMGFDGSHSMSVAFWVKSDMSEQTEYKQLMRWGRGDNAILTRFEMWMNMGGSQSGSDIVLGALRVRMGESLLIGSTDISDGKWYHVAFVYTTQGGNEPRFALYVNGQSEALSFSSIGHTSVDVRSVNARPMVIGSQDSSHSFDEVYIVKGALSKEEIQRLYHHKNL